MKINHSRVENSATPQIKVHSNFYLAYIYPGGNSGLASSYPGGNFSQGVILGCYTGQEEQMGRGIQWPGKRIIEDVVGGNWGSGISLSQLEGLGKVLSSPGRGHTENDFGTDFGFTPWLRVK